ncbi:hypothetical protein TTHERM_01098990 (macronuclear) [Tetrahymena thermophila SB210]|uniref:Transmembrane protein n=1 Tax=Tetrahymena thermophila (strain SB210) TaxID=312017 RepID=Q22BL4_TETTS|nr:hypothetical protein TTHERM_01098990 [Tetrahymena thermophila SB210]EAR82652.1 hypothetical protein TTHERM_01098990 [Tetrahymena thermophila SB210]|eukprot:XP_001030315.1 hypothetical protein TTHERM_01098990 [Tetrahymena thermophila SB210]
MAFKNFAIIFCIFAVVFAQSPYNYTYLQQILENEQCNTLKTKFSEECKKTSPNQIYPCLLKLMSENHCDKIAEYEQVLDSDKYCDSVKIDGEKECQGSEDSQCLVNYMSVNDCVSLIIYKEYVFDNDEYCNSIKLSLQESCNKEEKPIECYFQYMKVDDCVSEIEIENKKI